MNKTVTINISGIIFHIEEDAYEKLGKYLSTIKGYFQNTGSKEEIIADIESRIAEILQEKITAVKQVLLLADIDYVIAVMGQPEQFNQETSTDTREEHQQKFSYNKKNRVFRNPDDRILGGVCSGISAHFGIDSLWLRLLFVVFFFAFGSGVMIYFLLWMLLPKAVSASEKIEMRGEPVNIDNIEKEAQKTSKIIKDKINDFENEIKNTNTKDIVNGFKQFAEKVKTLLLSLFGGFFRAVAVTLSILAIIICLPIIIVLISFFSLSFDYNNWASTGLFLLLGIPLIAIVYRAFRSILKIKKRNKLIQVSFITFWFLGIVFTIVGAIQVYTDFSVEQKSISNLLIHPSSSSIIYLKSNEDPENFSDDRPVQFSYHHQRLKIMANKFIINMDEKKYMAHPKLNIVKSDDDSVKLIMTSISRGATIKEAKSLSEKVDYQINQTDSLVILDEVFEVSREEKWRLQQVQLTLQLPLNKMVYLDKSLAHLIYDVANVTNTYDGDMLNHKWIMREEGLTCVDCN